MALQLTVSPATTRATCALIPTRTPSRCCPGVPARTRSPACFATSATPAARSLPAILGTSSNATWNGRSGWVSPITWAASWSFFYLKNSQTPELLDFDGYFDQLSSYPASDLRRDTVLNLADMGIPVKYSHHEGALSQHEIDLEYTDALTMAGNLMTAKLVIKELAQL